LNKTADIVLHLKRDARGLESLIWGGINLVLGLRLGLYLGLILSMNRAKPDESQEDQKTESQGANASHRVKRSIATQ
jgi:hypothetical protein